jgi:RNA polymerase sigma-54 factor
MLNDTQIDTLRKEIRKLNPKPGAALGETESINIQQITPDFIVDTSDDGFVSFTLNQGNIPELKVSTTFSEMVDTYKNNKEGMNRQTKEALLYAKGKVDKAQGFIEAIKQRRHTLTVTMKAIINWQRKFFQDGDESDLKPMILKDIADKTGLDISTISRVSNVKYAQTRWGTFPLRFFFTDSYTTDDGEEMSTRKIKLALKEVIDKEDKKKPLSDDALAKIMKEKGYPIARRTIAKYREQMNLPVARLRRY